jgi:serine/threonine protein kinase
MLNRGDRIRDYVLLNKLGSGGFGDVWKAEKRTALDVNYFALKFFRPKDDQINFENIRKELAVWKQLRGLGNIISVIELDRFEDYVYVVSDFAEGGSLENWFKQNKKAESEAQAVEIVTQILQGLENLHEKGFVHRDLKPDNLLIMNGKLCLADFGISREVKTHSKATGTAGTIEYMPPEAFEKNPPVSPQTDIWAIGVILQKLLTGELPFPHEMPALMFAILQGEPEPMPETVSLGLREIVKKALQKRRENRFQSAKEMRAVLQNPNQFLIDLSQKETRATNENNAQTIFDEDFNKTEVLKVETTREREIKEGKKWENYLQQVFEKQLAENQVKKEAPSFQPLKDSTVKNERQPNKDEEDSGFVGILAASVIIILGIILFAILVGK